MCDKCKCKTCKKNSFFKSRINSNLKRLVAHSIHHSQKHISYMRALIRKGVSFKTAHAEALRKGYR